MRSIYSGIDRLDEAASALHGRRLGLITNPTGIDRRFHSTADLLNARFTLASLFAVEHGIRGDAQAGEPVENRVDAATGIPVYSLYGASRSLTPEHLDTFDVLCYDLQDVGARFYTHLCALSMAMEACAAAGKPVVVFDRVNPLGGERVEGTVPDERLASCAGMFALPTRYGLTIGEYARWVKARLGLDGLELTVVPLRGWRRSDWPDELDLPWVPPSPNCASFHTALLYPGTCVFEGTNLSEGRGTAMPFEYIGAPWIDPLRLERAMARHALPGLHFRACWFTPCASKHAGVSCGGVQVYVIDRNRANVVEGALTLLDEVRRLWPDAFRWTGSDAQGYAIDRLLGTASYRLGQYDAHALLEAHAPARRAFMEARRPFLLYD